VFKQVVQRLLNQSGFSLQRKSSVDRLLSDNAAAQEELQRLRSELRQFKRREIFYAITPDYHAHDKINHIANRIRYFGRADFAELACCIFNGSIINGRIIGQRINEASLLWRATKMSAGPILEIGRELGGSTLVLLGASDDRWVVSIDSAPRHDVLADMIFQRPDVAARLKLYEQSSRESIAETEFGMIFIDGDHSYPGICHDIGLYWNSLRSFDGKPPIAAFHDAADNPITYVEPVKRACEELLAEPGVARVVESWGSMLVLEKTADINPDRWYAKDHPEFWQSASPEGSTLRPVVIRGGLRADRPAIKTATTNLLGTGYVDSDDWVKRGLGIERLPLSPENPLRLLRELPESSEHGIERSVALDLSRFSFSAFLRPHQLEIIRLSVMDGNRTPIAYVDFRLSDNSRVEQTFANDQIEIADAGFLFQNGYFCCRLAIVLPTPIPVATFAINAADTMGKTSYQGDSRRGFFLNLSSVREIL
jgi:hypothetical protein